MESPDYEFVRRLGEGWSGVTWIAKLRHPKFGLEAGSDVALKVYKADILERAPKIRDRIKREAELGMGHEHQVLLKVLALEDVTITDLRDRHT